MNPDAFSTVVIGRFQPLHRGHLDLMRTAFELSDHLVVLLGSANGPRNLRNPFRAEERGQMLEKELDKLIASDSRFENKKYSITAVRDYFYNNLGWVNEVREKVRAVAPGRVALIGHKKDFSSSYLEWFPDWEFLPQKPVTICDSTGIRQSYLRNSEALKKFSELTPDTRAWLEEFAATEAYRNLQKEQVYVDAYKESWKSAPFPPVFVTTDVVLFCAEHVLLIQRKGFPGRGLWAHPGGFLEQSETLLDCALRELKEETNLNVSESELKASLVKVRVFDHPLRSSRGRTITHAHFIKLNSQDLPQVKANDDAAQVKWIPLLDVGRMESELFEDHFHMFNSFLRPEREV